MTEHDDLQAWLTLVRTPGVGALTLRQWLRKAGDIHAALALARREPALKPPARTWLGKPDAQRLARDMDWLTQPGHRLLRCTQADFPPQLDTLPGAPAALFVSGDAGLLLRPQIAIVGARGASPAGLSNARMFARALATTGLVVTSGLAEGVDGAAHAAALDAGTTIAVMGTGPDQVYPRRHRDLAASIARGGALVSEFVPGTGPRAGHFPRRNRVISGLSLGTLVIEASVRSGSLITARLAAEQGRAVFALPGSIHNPLARGCHRLIREGVQLVETVEEIVEALRPMAGALGADLEQRLRLDLRVRANGGAEAVATEVAPTGAEPVAAQAAPTGDAGSRQLLEAMGHGDPVAADTLSQRTGLPMKTVSATLLTLELDGHVAGASGGRYLRTD